MSSRPSTPPPSALNAAPPVNLTPEQVKRIEINRLKAKAKLRAKLSDDSASASSSSSTNAHKKRPLQVTPATSNSPTAPAAPPPLKRDSRLMGSYFEYDLSKMVNSKGGFLVEDKDDVDERVKEREKEREMQRTKHDLDARA
jgi:DNA-repair protein complementing XP-A cells